MKLTMKLLALFMGALMLAHVANAETPREQFGQMVQQLQRSPSDDALREKIIRLAQAMKHAPVVPAEAEKYEGRAQFAFKNAKSPADYLDAAKEYEKAVSIAPWVSGYYADLCTIYEKAEKYAEAKKSCAFFLVSSPSPQEASEVRKRIAGLEFAIEKGVSKKNQEDEFLKKLDGARFVRRGHDNFADGSGQDWMMFYEVRGNKIFYGTVITASSNSYVSTGKVNWSVGYHIDGREFTIPRNDQYCREVHQNCSDEIQTISEDGNKITERRTYDGKLEEKIYLREK